MHGVRRMLMRSMRSGRGAGFGAATAGFGAALWWEQKQNPSYAFFGFFETPKPPFDVKELRKDIVAAIEEHQAGPVFVRLAWHAAGTYDQGSATGGNYATMRFHPECSHAANAGLEYARKFLEPVKQKHPAISYADLWCLASCIAIEEAGGPKVPFRFGRQDGGPKDCTPDGRLPGAADEGPAGCAHARAIFNRMGFNDQEIIALLGAHALGHCHKDRSGYVGPWTHDPYSFTNEYYRLLTEYKWRLKPGAQPPQYEDLDTKTLMMLPIEMSFLTDPSFKKHVDRYAKDEAAFFQDFTKAYQKLMELGGNAKNLKGPIEY